MKMKVLVLNSGLHHKDAFNFLSKEASFIPVYQAKDIPLFKYDIIIIPCHTDQIALTELKKKLKEYIASGGVVVIFGATAEGGQWIPYCNWEGPYTKNLELFKESEDAKIIFDNLEGTNDLHYHGFYYAHGALIHTDCEVLASSEERAVMIIKRSDVEGTLFCTTLDPDFHSVTTVASGQSESECSNIRRKASRLCNNIVKWAKLEAEYKDKKLRRCRLIKGYFFYYLREIIYYVFILLPLVLLIYLIYSQSHKANLTNADIMADILTFIGFTGSFTDIKKKLGLKK